MRFFSDTDPEKIQFFKNNISRVFISLMSSLGECDVTPPFSIPQAK
jgi:hypothetical protein